MNNSGEHSTTSLKVPDKISIVCSVLDTNIDNYRRLSLQACDILNHLRCNNKLCDSFIKCEDGSEFPVHRAILSATSNFFLALFTNGMNDTENRTIEIKGIDSDIMKLLIEWSYTRNVCINSNNVERLLPSADRFQMLGLVSKCNEFLEKCLSYENVIGIKRFAAFYSNKLRKVANDYLMFNFVQIVNQSSEFFELTFEELNEILSSDDLNLKNENYLFEIIIKWINFSQNDRKKYLKDLILNLRIGFISKKYFFETIKNNLLIKQDQHLKPIIDKFSDYFTEFRPSTIIDFENIKIRTRTPHELLVVVGGWSSGSPTNSIETFDSRAELWQTFEHLDSTPRAYHGCLYLNRFIYTIGGFNGSNFFNNCRRFSLDKKEWEEISPMHMKRCYVSVAILDGFIYAMGGFDGHGRHNTAEKYNPEQNQWSLISNMNENRSDASSCELNRRIYICGGFNGSYYLDSAEFYDPETNVWTQISRMSSRRGGLGVTSLNGCLYAIGGYDGFNRLTSCEKYDPKAQVWTRIPDMFCPRSNFGVAILDESIFVIGGFDGITTIQNVESYNEERSEWKIREKMSLKRSALSVCIIKGIDLVRPYLAPKIDSNQDSIINQNIFLSKIINFSNHYINYFNYN